MCTFLATSIGRVACVKHRTSHRRTALKSPVKPSANSKGVNQKSHFSVILLTEQTNSTENKTFLVEADKIDIINVKVLRHMAQQHVFTIYSTFNTSDYKCFIYNQVNTLFILNTNT